MTKKDFSKKIFDSRRDILQEFVSLLRKKRIPFCVIGGLAVNAYAEPVVSLDFDVVVEASRLAGFLEALPGDFRIKRFPNSDNITGRGSDVRIQIQRDIRYQPFISKAVKKDVLGYKLPVARVEDILKGKIWAALDEARRPSKRQKDLADILRLVEGRAYLAKRIPASIKRKFAF
jgi:hypothetical protein